MLGERVARGKLGGKEEKGRVKEVIEDRIEKEKRGRERGNWKYVVDGVQATTWRKYRPLLCLIPHSNAYPRPESANQFVYNMMFIFDFFFRILGRKI